MVRLKSGFKFGAGFPNPEQWEIGYRGLLLQDLLSLKNYGIEHNPASINLIP
jgi:hypothetical protein